jgi:hypothetical protein
MVKDRALWTAWEAQGPLREPFSPSRALALAEAMYEYARSLGAFPPADPLAGLEIKISLARTVNVQTAPGETLARGLEQRQIPYMVIGGQAVLICGV